MKSLFNFLTSKGQLGALLLAVLCIAIVLGSIFSGLASANYEVGTDLVAILKNKESKEAFNFFNAAIMIPMVLIIIAAVLLVLFGLKSLLSDPKGSMKFIISTVVIVLLFFVFYSMSDNETTGKVAALIQKFNVSPGVSKFISGGIKTTLLLVGASVVAAIVGEILNFFK